jgi:hypothetical protein
VVQRRRCHCHQRGPEAKEAHDCYGSEPSELSTTKDTRVRAGRLGIVSVCVAYPSSFTFVSDKYRPVGQQA